jgi:hypothetical protein
VHLRADAYFEDVPDVTLSDEMIDLASHIIERKRPRSAISACTSRSASRTPILLAGRGCG